jgi:hypothetical protein
MMTEQTLVAFMGWWELVVIGAFLLVPATVIAVGLLVVMLARRKGRTRTPPRLPPDHDG